MKKVLYVIFLVVFIIGVVFGIKTYKEYDNSVSDKIPEGYMFVFHGGSGEVTRSTYIYKIDNGHANMGFKYVNTENHTKHWGSSEWIIKIVDQGEFDWTDGAFTVAKKHGAYDYVAEVGSDKTFTIEEYQSRFIMN